MELSKICVAANGNQLSRQTDDLRDRLTSALRLIDEIAIPPAVRPANQVVTEREIREILRQRRNRDRFFDAELFADPAWDILLELYGAELGQHRLSVSSV